MPARSVLVVEDRPLLAGALCQGLLTRGVEARIFRPADPISRPGPPALGGEIARLLDSPSEAVVVLISGHLPGEMAVSLACELRLVGECRPLVWSFFDRSSPQAKGAEMLDGSGASGWIRAPFSIEELLQRIQVLRAAPPSTPEERRRIRAWVYAERLDRMARRLGSLGHPLEKVQDGSSLERSSESLCAYRRMIETLNVKPGALLEDWLFVLETAVREGDYEDLRKAARAIHGIRNALGRAAAVVRSWCCGTGNAPRRRNDVIRELLN